jgi:hypothetical protein
MQALRTIYKIENNFINISLPIDFKSVYVEVIILPYNKKEEIVENLIVDKEGISDFQKLLLNAPIMSDEDFNYFQEKQNHFNQWK